MNDHRQRDLIGTRDGKRVILDGFGHPFRYRSAKDDNGKPVPNMRNESDFDLWSIGPDGLRVDLKTPGDFTRKGTGDDIWE